MIRKVPSILACLVLVAGCGKKGAGDEAGEREAPEQAELSAFELENGIGPIKEQMVLGPLDAALVEKGKGIFELKCSMCHKMDTTYVGPPLGEVSTRRTPAFIMNMILNPQEMVERHPVAKQLLAERMSFMANQGLSVDEARALLEYLRTQSKTAAKP